MSQRDAEHERWETLIEREAIGESLTPEEQEFVARYEAAHVALAHERAVFEAAIDSLREQLDDQDDELTLAREAQAALARYRSERDGAERDGVERDGAERDDERTRVGGFNSRLAIGVASVAAAAGLTLWLGLRDSNDDHGERVGAHELESPRERAPEQRRHQPVDPTPPPAAPVDPIGRLSMLSSSAPIDRLGALLEPGSSVASLFEPELRESVERACVSWSEPTAVVCFEGELSSSSSAAVGERRVRLESGRLVAALAPLGPGQRFTVETLLGTVSAIGTVFAVEIYEGSAWVTVLEGRVELRDPTVRVLAAGHRTSLRGEVPGDEPTPLEPDAIPTAVAELVGFAELLRASPGEAQLQIPRLGGRAVVLDDQRLDGPALLSIGAGEHALQVLDQQQAITLEQAVTLAPGTVVDLAETLPAAPASAEPHEASKPPSAKQLADAAQRERGKKNYKETARLYRELLRRYPDSPEAANVPVRLGDLLTSTGDHEGALAAYELYLERGAKQLTPEAEYGRIQALRALGRKADERAAIEAFVAARPGDYRCTELKTRLAELEK